MLTIILHFIIVAVAILLVAHFLPGITIRNFGSAFIAALVLGLVNALIGPILKFITAPINWLTFGLFAIVINGILLKIVAEIVDDFEVRDWLSAIIGSILISLASSIMHRILIW